MIASFRSAPLVLALAASVTLLAGCQKATEAVAQKAVEKALGVEVNQDGNQVVFKGKEGNLSVTSGEGTALPAGFPSDVPLPENAKVESVMEFGESQIVTLVVPDLLDTVVDEAGKRMVAEGWKQELRSITVNEGGMLVYSKEAEDRSVSLIFSESGEGNVQMSVTVKAAAKG